MRRRSIDVAGFQHWDQPTPAASRVGDIVFTGGTFGSDPATGQIPEGDLAAQTRFMFHNLERILDAAGCDMADIVKIEFYVRDAAATRAHLNPAWLAAFPDPASRPARHIFVYPDLPPAMLIQADAFAVASRPIKE